MIEDFLKVKNNHRSINDDMRRNKISSSFVLVDGQQETSLEYNALYDVQTTNGQVFEACAIGYSVETHTREEQWTSTSDHEKPFVEIDGLGNVSLINTDLRLRYNSVATDELRAEKKESQRKDKLASLYEQRTELDAKIAKLEK